MSTSQINNIPSWNIQYSLPFMKSRIAYVWAGRLSGRSSCVVTLTTKQPKAELSTKSAVILPNSPNQEILILHQPGDSRNSSHFHKSKRPACRCRNQQFYKNHRWTSSLPDNMEHLLKKCFLLPKNGGWRTPYPNCLVFCTNNIFGLFLGKCKCLNSFLGAKYLGLAPLIQYCCEPFPFPLYRRSWRL